MTDAVWVIFAMIVGFALGLGYFTGLWAMVRRLPTARHPALLTVVSLAARLAVAAGVFYAIGAGDWRRFLAAGLGFAGARLALVRRWSEGAETASSEGGLPR